MVQRQLALFKEQRRWDVALCYEDYCVQDSTVVESAFPNAGNALGMVTLDRLLQFWKVEGRIMPLMTLN
jgi:hypothetical protein